MPLLWHYANGWARSDACIRLLNGSVAQLLYYTTKIGGERDVKGALEAFEKACELGNVEGCHNAGNFWGPLTEQLQVKPRKNGKKYPSNHRHDL